MAKKNTENKIKNYFYLAGPLALVAFALLDYIGGTNFPGFDWSKNIIQDLNALNSHCFIMSMVLLGIACVLTLVAVFCVFKFFKDKNINKILKNGIILFIVAAIIASVGTLGAMQPESGMITNIKDKSEVVMKTETVTTAEDNVVNADGTPSGVEDSGESTTETREVVDEEATSANFQEIVDTIQNPLLISSIAVIVLAALLGLISFVMIIIGGFKNDGISILAFFAIFCAVLVVFSIVACIVFNVDMFGTSLRFSSYAPFVFLALMCGFIYVTNDLKE